MSSEKYEELEDDLQTHLQEIETSIQHKLPKLSGESRKGELRNIERTFEDADVELSQMFDEAQSAPGTYKTNMISRSRGYKARLDKLRKEYKKVTSASYSASYGATSNRNDLIGVAKQQENQNNVLQNKMAQGLASLDRGTQSLARSELIAAETDEIGVQIIGDLDDQRETLLRTKDKLDETREDLSRSQKVLNAISLKLGTNKLLLVVIIILELAVIGGIVYIRFIKD